MRQVEEMQGERAAIMESLRDLQATYKAQAAANAACVR